MFLTQNYECIDVMQTTDLYGANFMELSLSGKGEGSIKYKVIGYMILCQFWDLKYNRQGNLIRVTERQLLGFQESQFCHTITILDLFMHSAFPTKR